MTWLFVQVWLWSLIAFVLGSLITWLLFALPLRRKLNAALAHISAGYDGYFEPAPDVAPPPPPLDLFQPEPQRAIPGSDTLQDARGMWLSAAPTTSLDGAVQTRSGLAELASPGNDSPTLLGSGEAVPAGIPGGPRDEAEHGDDGHNGWFAGDAPVTAWPPEVPEQRSWIPFPSTDPDGGQADPPVAPQQDEVTQELPRLVEASQRAAESADQSSGDYLIKGHFASRKYHTPDSPEYDSIVAEVWFRNVEDAEQAGFAPWNGQPAP